MMFRPVSNEGVADRLTGELSAENIPPDFRKVPD